MINQGVRILLKNIRTKHLWIFLLLSFFCAGAALGCLPGRGGGRRRGPRKLTPLVFKQHVPNVAEDSLAASGPPDERISRNSSRFKLLVPNYNEDIIFKDEEGTGVDRLMTKRCKEKLDTLAISVMNQWPGVKLRVTEGFDEEGHHSSNSLHYSGRAADITTSDRDRAKYGMLARLAVEAGFSWVYYESRGHIHCSVKSDSVGSGKTSGCFHGSVTVATRNGTKSISDVKIGDEIVSSFSYYGSAIYSPVISFLHRNSDTKTQFIHFRTSSGATLLVTPNHLIFKSTHQTVETIFASELKTGDSLLSVSSDNILTKTYVTDLTVIFASGVFAPLTADGTIVANNIVVSCYALVDNHELAHALFLPIRANYALKKLGWDFENFFVNVITVIETYGPTWIASRVMNMRNQWTCRGIHWYAELLCWLTAPVFSFCK